MLFSGCATQKHEVEIVSLTCEVHHVPMQVQDLKVGMVQKVYSSTFQEGVGKRFPHPGLYRHIPDNWYHDVISVRAPVCPQCTKAYRVFEEEWPAMKP